MIQWYKALSFTKKMLFAMATGAILGVALESIQGQHDWINFYSMHESTQQTY